jgi:hypothetical protein
VYNTPCRNFAPGLLLDVRVRHYASQTACTMTHGIEDTQESNPPRAHRVEGIESRCQHIGELIQASCVMDTSVGVHVAKINTP